RQMCGSDAPLTIVRPTRSVVMPDGSRIPDGSTRPTASRQSSDGATLELLTRAAHPEGQRDEGDPKDQRVDADRPDDWCCASVRLQGRRDAEDDREHPGQAEERLAVNLLRPWSLGARPGLQAEGRSSRYLDR